MCQLTGVAFAMTAPRCGREMIQWQNIYRRTNTLNLYEMDTAPANMKLKNTAEVKS
jgi:hypothetical protein